MDFFLQTIFIEVFRDRAQVALNKTLVIYDPSLFCSDYFVFEVITDEEAEHRGDGPERSYNFSLDYDADNDQPFCIDARRKGNVARFINHSVG